MDGACPDEAELLAQETGAELTPRGLREHLDACDACRARREALRRDARLFRALQDVARPAAGPPRIPGYHLEGELVRGGQGVVYRAVQEATSRVVALKVLAGRRAPGARDWRRFEREVELGSRLAHPGIVTLFDSGIAEGTPWYAMELVDGDTLDVHLARTAPALETRLRLFLELCAAVAHAHRSGVIHRDLKPGNVLVDRNGRVRVLDFGTALPTAAARLTAPDEFLGTLAYASPEQVSGGEVACDTRTDVYSLGVVLHELLTGKLPQSVEGGLSEVVARILHEPPAVLREPRPALDRELVAILARALEKDRERRYPSVESLARDVERFLAHEPLEARPRAMLYVLRKALRRHRRAALAAGVVLALAALLGGALLDERLNARRARGDAALVRSVFEDILGAAAPGRMGGDAPLRDVLALAAREIEATLADAPDAQAAVQRTIGDTYLRLLMHAEAERHLRLALARFLVVDGNGLESATTLELLGHALTPRGLSEAIAVQEEALAIRRRRLDPGDALIASSERSLAEALMAQVRDADNARAATLLDSALARFRAGGGASAEIAATQLDQARLAGRFEDPVEAERLFAAALQGLEQVPERERDPRLIECLAEYSAFLQSQRRYEEAERLLGRAEELTRAYYGDALTSDLLRRRASIAFARGERAGSEELTRRALAFELRRWSDTRREAPAEVGAALAGLAGPGEDAYLPAFRLLMRFRGEGNFELAGWMNDVARLLDATGRRPAGEALLRAALDIRCRAYGEQCPVRQVTLQRLGEWLGAEGRTAEARALLTESLSIAEHNGEPGDVASARAALERCGEDRP